MRILQVLGTSAGGVGTHVRALARELADTHQVAVLAPTSTLEHFDLRGQQQITPLVCEMSTRLHPRDIISIRQLRMQVKSFQPDIIHAHGFRAGLLTLLATRQVPVVVSWHNQASGRGIKGWLETRVESFIARRAKLILGASEDLVQRARDCGAPGAQFAPVAAPAPVQVSATMVQDLREELGAQDSLLGVMIGRVSPQKNYGLMLRSAARLTDLSLTIAVAGAEDLAVRAALDTMMAKTDLGRVNVRFLGARNDVSTLLAAADFFLLTSHWEARALVVQEALMAGTPVIASDVGGIPGLVGSAGILIDPATATAPAEFADAIRSLADPAERAHYGRLSSERGRNLPTETDVAQIMEQHYKALIEP